MESNGQFAFFLRSANQVIHELKTNSRSENIDPASSDKIKQIISKSTFASLKESHKALKVANDQRRSLLGEKMIGQKRKLEVENEKPTKTRRIEPSSLVAEAECSDEEHIEAMHEVLERNQVVILAFQLLTIPPCPTPKDVEPMLEGLSAKVLRKAEEMVGRQMNRVDALWWSLLYRDFGPLGGQWNNGIREVYKNYEALLGV